MRQRWRELGNLVLLPALVVMQVFDLRRAVVGPGWVYSSYLIGFSLVVIVGLPMVWPALRRIPRPLWIILAAFAALLAYAAMTVWVSGPETWPIHQRTYAEGKPLPPGVRPQQWDHRMVPLLTALVTMLAAVVVVLLVQARRRAWVMWWAAWVLLVTSLLGWPRAMAAHDSPRLASGMGGSAVLHVVFLLVLGLFLGAAAQGLRRWWSLAGAAVALGCVLLTGSRAGLVTLAVFAVLVLVWVGGRVSLKWSLLALAALVAVGAVLVAVTPFLRRLLNGGDQLRQENLATGWRLFISDWTHTVFGVGSGKLWPWYAYDARLLRPPYRGRVQTVEGIVQTNPHSVPLAVGVELGLVGLVLLAVIVVVLVVSLIRARRAAAGLGGVADGLRLAVVASLAAFAFDHYLFKNFGISFWWWVCLATVFLLPRPGDGDSSDGDSSGDGACGDDSSGDGASGDGASDEGMSDEGTQMPAVQSVAL